MALAIPLTGAPVEHPLALLVAALLLVTLFGALGVVVGIYAETFDHHTFVNNIVILPLTFVGGVFYSVDILPVARGRRSRTRTRSSTWSTPSATASSA